MVHLAGKDWRKHSMIREVLFLLAVVALVGLAQPSWSQQVLDADNYASMHVEGNMLGDLHAPVLVEVYSDFQCPHCKTIWLTTMIKIEASYVANGKVWIASYSMGNRLSEHAKGNTESEDAARAAYAAAEQNRYWVYHDLLFTTQGKVNSGTFSMARLTDDARMAGLNMAQFQAAMASDELKARVARDALEGKSRGVRIVPTIFVNGTRVEGEQSFETYKTAIEAALLASREGTGNQ
jgi:protein-disulfide isomerase